MIWDIWATGFPGSELLAFYDIHLEVKTYSPYFVPPTLAIEVLLLQQTK